MAPPPVPVPAMLVAPATAPPVPAEAPPVPGDVPPAPVPAELVAPALPPAELSSELSVPHAASAVAETKVALNAKVAARPSRVFGNWGSGLPARSSGRAQNGHAASETRT